VTAMSRVRLEGVRGSNPLSSTSISGGCSGLALQRRRAWAPMWDQIGIRSSVEGAQKASRRSRGTVRKHRAGYQVRVSAGTDPVTGERLRLQGTAPTMREAERLRTKLLGEADTFRSARTNASLGYLLDRWLPQHDVDENTRESYG
jgi:hypothetical protein